MAIEKKTEVVEDNCSYSFTLHSFQRPISGGGFTHTMPPPRREFGAVSFPDPVSGKKNDDPENLDGTEYGTWIQRIAGSYNYFGRSSDLKFGAWTRRTAGNYRYSGNLDGAEFRWLAQREEDDVSGDTSPPLWKEASSPKFQPDEGYPIRSHHHRCHGNCLNYPTSRSQDIANYRREMMEMVRDVPESAYELSLRDLVELPGKARSDEENPAEAMGPSEKKKDQKKIEKGKSRILRSERMGNGAFLIKMFFPISLGRRRRRRSGAAATGSKVSPKPVFLDGEKCGPEKSVDDDRWKKNGWCGETSSSTNSCGRRRKNNGCYPFFNTNKGKTGGY